MPEGMNCWILLRMMFQIKLVEKIRTHFSCFFLQKSCRLWDVEKYGTAGQARGNSIIRSLHISCWISKTANTHTKYISLFHRNNGCAKAPQCYIIRTLPVCSLWCWQLPLHGLLCQSFDTSNVKFTQLNKDRPTWCHSLYYFTIYWSTSFEC